MIPAVDELGGDDAPQANVEADPVRMAQRSALHERIRIAVAALPDAQREVFLLRERAGLDFQSIAATTGEKLATVKSRMRYALEHLRRRLAPELASAQEQHHE